MIVFAVICLILFAGLGTCANYLGVSSVMTAFELAGGSAIGMFCSGVALIIISLINFGWVSMNVKLIIDEIRGKAPTADVVPKSEVDWNSIPVDVSEALKQRAVEKAKTDVAREIFEEIDLIFRNQFEKCSQNTEFKLLEPLCQAERFVINELWHEVAELKKKYTEGDDEQ